MANTYTNLDDLFTDMADAIREKKDSTATIIADTFPNEIDSLRTGFDYNNQNVTEIPAYAFYNCEDLKSVDCYNLTSVGASAFENCTNLKTVILYDGVVDVGEKAFDNCDNVIIYYKGPSILETWHENWNPDNRPVICGKASINLIETYDISTTSDDDATALLYNTDTGDKYTLHIYGSGKIADFYKYNSSLAPWYSLYSTNIGSIIIQDGITSIGDNAFYGCTSLTSITIPSSVTSIDYGAFQNCTSLTSVTIPDSVTSIGDGAFHSCRKLTSIAYTGTTTQWNAITFDNYWNDDTGNYIIHCTDGDIAKDGTITYH